MSTNIAVDRVTKILTGGSENRADNQQRGCEPVQVEYKVRDICPGLDLHKLLHISKGGHHRHSGSRLVSFTPLSCRSESS